MIITHNLGAMNAQRVYRVNTDKGAKSTEKLSSGYRINRAADDAAGLAISEKMRWQIRGLDKAEVNCETGVSFCQVADGAMVEMEDMLHRMKELSVQAANDTNTSIDRAQIQTELDHLTTEIERITKDTRFNTLPVFGEERRETITVPNPNGGETIVSQKTYYPGETQFGLADILGSDKIHSGKKLDDQVTLGNGWKTTGEDMYTLSNPYKRMTASEVKSYLSSLTGKSFPDNFLTQKDSYGTQSWPSGNPITASIIYDPTKNTDGSYSAKNITINDNTGKVINTLTKLADGTSGSPGKADGKAYGTAWIDFSGLGTDYSLEDLYGQGFNSTCATCSKYYSIQFTNSGGDMVTGDPSNAPYSFSESGITASLKINISGLDSAEKITDAIMQAAGATKGFSGHFTQYATNPSEKGKIYIFDNRHTYAGTGGRSTFEPSPRSETGELIVETVTVHNPITQQVKTIEPKDLWIQAGATEFNGLFVKRPKISAMHLGVHSINVDNFEDASTANAAVTAAIDILNSERAKVGAQQNRLEHSAIIDANTSENSSAAESRIRDTDMAKEMVSHSISNILARAGESMMAQANQSTQSVLSLLQ